eukprot:gnl/Trimastix_PCT/2449.p2 GENE.gnl/Trimastix_PCT/2449~~gnl/Trimastix_PCT/2449.p2  ORF type:complete len:195 (+),score=51.76 gnl/Trimastix_PCT/2449:374-958(+)
MLASAETYTWSLEQKQAALAAARKADATGDSVAALEALLERTRVISHEYQRADYHISWGAVFEVRGAPAKRPASDLTDTDDEDNGDVLGPMETARFTMSWNGDNEGCGATGYLGYKVSRREHSVVEFGDVGHTRSAAVAGALPVFLGVPRVQPDDLLRVLFYLCFEDRGAEYRYMEACDALQRARRGAPARRRW